MSSMLLLLLLLLMLQNRNWLNRCMLTADNANCRAVLMIVMAPSSDATAAGRYCADSDTILSYAICWQRHRCRQRWDCVRMQRIIDGQMCLILMSYAYGFLLLPYEYIVHHGTATEHNAETDEDAGDDGRRRMELSERIQDDTWRNGNTRSV